MITEEEYMALAREKYQELQALNDKTTLRDHEELFTTIWTDWGQQLLGKTISQPTKDRRKKKR